MFSENNNNNFKNQTKVSLILTDLFYSKNLQTCTGICNFTLNIKKFAITWKTKTLPLNSIEYKWNMYLT